MSAEPKLWRDRHPMVDPAHEAELESRAAVHELGGTTRPVAEDQAYQDYLQAHLRQGAAHHLAGMRAAHAAGDLEQAARHGILYGLMAKTLGFNPHGEPPAEVVAMSRDPKLSKVYDFRGHGADAVVLEHLRRRSQTLGKTEADLGGQLVDRAGGRELWDMSHCLPETRRAQGERLLVSDGDQRVAHHVREEEGRRVPLATVSEQEEGPPRAWPLDGVSPDVLQAAGIALRARRLALLGQAAASGRAALAHLERLEQALGATG